MGWLKKDDQFHDHEKVDGLSDAANRLWDICACWCSKRNNRVLRGLVPRHEIMRITKRRWPEDVLLELARELVEANPGNRYTAGLWEECDDGWKFHDWSVYQPVDDDDDGGGPLTLTERARRAGMASAAKRKEKYGSAQPIKMIHDVSNSRTSSTSSELVRAPNLGTSSTSSMVGTQLSLGDTNLPNDFGKPPELVPELSKKTQQVRALVRDEKVPDSSSVLELDEVVRRTKPRTCRTPVNPLRDLKLNSLSQGPDRDRKTDCALGVSECGPDPGSVSVERPKTLTPCERDANSYNVVAPAVLELFRAWREEARKPNAELTWRRREGFERCVSEGVTVEVVRRVVRGAKTDLDWAVGKHRLDPTAILFSTEQREKYLDIESETHSTPKRTGPQLFKPETRRDPSTLVTAEQMQASLATLAIGVVPAKPKEVARSNDATEAMDPAAIERINQARQKSRRALAEFEQTHKSEPPPPVALEA